MAANSVDRNDIKPLMNERVFKRKLIAYTMSPTARPQSVRLSVTVDMMTPTWFLPGNVGVSSFDTDHCCHHFLKIKCTVKALSKRLLCKQR